MSDQVGLDEQADLAEAETASASQRMGWLVRNVRVWIIILVLLIVAGIVVSVSFASFTSSSANAGNIVATGSLVIDDDIDNGAILQVTGLVPGDTATGTVTISNIGESSGTFSLSQTGLIDAPGPNGGSLSDVLELQIVMDASTVVYSGPFAGLDTVQLGEWAGGESHTFDFNIEFPDGGDDNEFQQSQVTTTYIWDAVTT